MSLVPWDFITVICLGAIAIFGWVLVSTIRDIKRISDENTLREFRYNSEYAEYTKKKKKIEAQNEINGQKIPKLRDEFAQYNTDVKKCQEVLNQVYQANVLPMRYRNKYVAMYLYDFFKHSMLDDLDAAINTCVLEQIKDKLEEMIEMQAQTIVNQRIMIANQRMAIEEQREYAAYMKQKAKRITDNLEEQNLYLSMIESNTAATAFFAAADYLRD